MKNLKTAQKVLEQQPQFVRRATIEHAVKCGRCRAEVAVNDCERCWYCGKPLCHDCFEDFRQCGHENDKHVKVRR